MLFYPLPAVSYNTGNNPAKPKGVMHTTTCLWQVDPIPSFSEKDGEL
ncbi:MAG: hypothetical protein K9G49_09765 [Taibaiella sp.]|nr:hypothetical protein [Taibaiella sp.]